MLISALAVVGVFLLFVAREKTIVIHSKVRHETLWFVNFSENTIEFKAKENLNQRFSDLIQSVRNGDQQLRVLHIGDSHIQADFFTGETRRLISNWLLDSNTTRGFTFPYQVASSNNPDDYNVAWKGSWKRNRLDGASTAKLGVAGISLSTSDSTSELSLSLNKSKVRFQPFDRVRVLFDATDSVVVPRLSNSKIIHKGFNTLTYELVEPLDTLLMGIDWNGAINSSFTLYGLELANSKSKLVYNAAGVNGASVKTFLQSENFDQQAQQLDPNLVVVSLGTNDAFSKHFNPRVFRNNLSFMVLRIQEMLPNAMVILTTPGDHLIDGVKDNPSLARAQKQIHSVAKEYGCGVWDFYRVMGGEGSIKFWSQLGLTAPDKLHLNRKGYKLQGALFFDALTKLSGDTQELYIDELMFAND